MNRFDTYLPCEALRPYIKHYAMAEVDDESTYKVFPSTAITLGIQYKGRLIDVTNSENSLSAAGVTGLQDRFKLFKNTKSIGTLLVYFTETGASAFFKTPAHYLFSESISLDTFISTSFVKELEERIAVAVSDRARIAVLEQLLLSLLHNMPPIDSLVANAVKHIFDAKGVLRIKHLAGELNISQSAFEKRFRQWVGASPKKFASIVRFQSLVSAYNIKVANLTEMAYEAGYYDQAHFINDFKNFTGETPEKFFSK